MYLFTLAMASDVEGASNMTNAAGGLVNLLPMVAIFLVFYFLLIRPQMKKQKEVQNMIKELKKGDRVIAAGGLVGKIIKIEDDLITLEVDNDTKIQVVKGSVTESLIKKTTAK